MPLPPLVSLAQPQIRALVSRVPMPNENLAGRTIAGYRLLERVGEGGTAEVYRAQHAEHGTCAFKVLRSRLASDPTAVKRFLREAGYGSRVEHPGVVRTRSEEHTSELQSQSNLVCRLLLEKKKDQASDAELVP